MRLARIALRKARSFGRQGRFEQLWLLLGLAQQAQQQIGRAVRLAARYTPWDSNCFAQAVAARALLGLYGVPYALFFGVKRAPQAAALDAHAWVAAGRVPVTGGAGFGEFTVVGCFVDPGSQGSRHLIWCTALLCNASSQGRNCRVAGGKIECLLAGSKSRGSSRPKAASGRHFGERPLYRRT